MFLANTLMLAAVTAFIAVIAAVVLAYGLRLSRSPIVACCARFAGMGYALPGAVIAVGVLLPLAFVDHSLDDFLRRTFGISSGLLLTGSMAGLVFAYLVRFLAPAYQAVDASLAKVSPTMTLSALSLGASPRRILTRVHLPLARSGVLVAIVMVVIDAVKELPVVLTLRPFGFTTISVWVYQLATENFWQKAALPALLIVAAAIVPVFLLFRQVRLVDPHRSPDD